MAERKRLRLALIGVTGVGKSALGNTILQKNAFQSQCASDSVTVQCESKSQEIDGVEIIVVDTPGFQDTSRCLEEIKLEVAKSVQLLSPGPHAFLIVLNPSRFHSADRQCLKDIENLFGDAEFYKHAVVVFTRKNEIYNDDNWTTIHDFVRMRACEEVQEVITKCSSRVIAVENLVPKEAKDAESRTVLQFVHGLIESNDSSFYNHAYFRIIKSLSPSEVNPQNLKRNMEKVAEEKGWQLCTIL